MDTVFEENPAVYDNEEYPFDGFWFWLTEEHPEGCKLHFHKEIEFIYVAAGRIDIWINNKKYTIGSEKFIMIHPNESHRIICTSDVCYYFGVRFDPAILYTTKQTVAELKCLIPFCISPGNRQRIFDRSELSRYCDIRNMLESIVNECEKKPLGFTFLVRNRITAIFVAIIRAWQSQSTKDDSNISNELAATMQYAQNYIINNCTDVNEAELAKKCNMSYSYFSRSFKKLMGMSFSEYVNNVRINEAQRMLVSNNYSISEVAQNLGFSSSSHFIRTFKALKGVTPNQFRQQYFSDK